LNPTFVPHCFAIATSPPLPTFVFGQRPVMTAKMEQEQVLLALLEVQRLEAELERLENEEVKE
jgi:hypothetical protein